jgi:hypothetical protein
MLINTLKAMTVAGTAVYNTFKTTFLAQAKMVSASGAEPTVGVSFLTALAAPGLETPAPTASPTPTTTEVPTHSPTSAPTGWGQPEVCADKELTMLFTMRGGHFGELASLEALNTKMMDIVMEQFSAASQGIIPRDQCKTTVDAGKTSACQVTFTDQEGNEANARLVAKAACDMGTVLGENLAEGNNKNLKTLIKNIETAMRGLATTDTAQWEVLMGSAAANTFVCDKETATSTWGAPETTSTTPDPSVDAAQPLSYLGIGSIFPFVVALMMATRT